MLEPADIRLHWDRVKLGLEEIKVRLGTDWRPEDLYAMLRSGTAELLVGEEGFIIVQPVVCQFTLAKELHVLAAHGDSNGERIVYLEYLKAYAADIGASTITFRSTRRGLEKLPGVKINFVEFSVDVE